MNAINKVIDKFILFLAGVAGVALGFLLIAICVSTLSRFLFNRPFSNLIEYAAYCLIFITFFGAPWLLKQRKHICVDVFVMTLSQRKQWIMDVVIDIMGLMICVLTTVAGATVTYGNIVNNVLIMDSMGTPQWILIISIPIGSFFMGIQFIRNGVQSINLIRQNKSESEGKR